jgi:hypothetical protein
MVSGDTRITFQENKNSDFDIKVKNGNRRGFAS